MSSIQELRTQLANEVIDLTGDSPVSVRTRTRGSRRRHPPELQLREFPARHSQLEDVLPGTISFMEPTPSFGADNSGIQMIDEIRPLRDVRQTREISTAESNKQYDVAVPCLIDPYNGEQIVLSCPICFEPLVTERQPMATSCGHVFCAICLKQTFQGTKNKTCPKCNGPVKLKSCIRLYL